MSDKKPVHIIVNAHFALLAMAIFAVVDLVLVMVFGLYEHMDAFNMMFRVAAYWFVLYVTGRKVIRMEGKHAITRNNKGEI